MRIVLYKKIRFLCLAIMLNTIMEVYYFRHDNDLKDALYNGHIKYALKYKYIHD